jgi:hypothetical protein
MNTSMYGRKWQLEVLCNDGTLFVVGGAGLTGMEPLRCTFDINYPGYEGWYFSEFVLWNTSKETQAKMIQEGAEVYFYAGYADGRYGQIFGGKVFQSMFTRENVTDYKLTLSCMDGERLFKDNFVNIVLDKTYSDRTLINAIAARSETPIKLGNITAKIKDKPYPRGTTMFGGAPSTHIREVAKNNAAQFFMVNNTLQLYHLEDNPQKDYINVNYKCGLIGTPQQVDYGISFRSLLNPDLVLANPLKWVRLDISKINVIQQKAVPNKDRVPPLPVDGWLKVGGVRHFGDTRGDDWYTDVVGFSTSGKTPYNTTLPEMTKKDPETSIPGTY